MLISLKKISYRKSILKPFFKPTKADEKGMGTYSILKTDKYIIFPYNADGSLISIDVMKKNIQEHINIWKIVMSYWCLNA